MPTFEAAVGRFLAEGVARLAPIALSLRFDPTYYREVHPEYAELSDSDAYAHWLNDGLGRNWPGSPEEHLVQLRLPLARYPDTFRWQSYARARGLECNRWFALQHLADAGLIEGENDAWTSEGGSEFAAALGFRYRGERDYSAVLAFERARALGDFSPETSHQLADAYYRLENWRKALAHFRHAGESPHAEIWTFVNGAKAACRLGAYRTGLELLEAMEPERRRDPLWRQTLQDLVEARFAARTRRARRLYALPGGRRRADALVARAVRQAEEGWNGLDPAGAPLGGDPHGPILILASFDIRACVEYRVQQKVELLKLMGRTCRVFPLEGWRGFIEALPGAAAAIVFRLPAWPTVTRAMAAARLHGVPIFYDVDDLIFDADEYPEPQSTYGGLISDADYQSILYGTPLFLEAVKRADYGIAPTTILARALEPLVRSRRASVVPNGLDSRHAPFVLVPPRPNPAGTVTIVYASGTKAHNDDFNDLAGDALVQVLQSHPEARLLVIGHLKLGPAFDTVSDQVLRIDFMEDAAVVWARVAECQVNLAVLRSSPATDAKSEIKWLEAAILGVPSIVSATATYLEVLENEHDALISDTPSAWRDALERMVANASLRDRIGTRAREKALVDYGAAAVSESLRLALAPAFAVVGRPGTQRRRVLLCVAGAPDTPIGVSGLNPDVIDALLTHGQDEFEYAILTDGGTRSEAIGFETWGPTKLTVARVHLPDGNGGLLDSGVRRLISEWLELWRPDVLHLSAPDRLSLPAAEAALLAGLPYVVSLGRPWIGLSSDEMNESKAADEARRKRRTLRAAAAVIAPSQATAQRQREDGCPEILVLREPSPSPRPRAARGAGKLRMLMVVGGHSEDARRIEAALNASVFDRVCLTIVHPEHPDGVLSTGVWGATSVRRIGARTARSIRRLLADHDVLINLGRFGNERLTVEALSAGLQVVVDSGGAAAEYASAEESRWVVDEGDPLTLLRVLTAFNASPCLEVAVGTDQLEVRKIRERSGRQHAAVAAELMKLYRTITPQPAGEL